MSSNITVTDSENLLWAKSPETLRVLTLEEYQKDKNSMCAVDMAFCNAMAYTSAQGSHCYDLNDTEQFIASLKGILVESSDGVKGPIGVDDRLARLASERNVTGMAHNLTYK